MSPMSMRTVLRYQKEKSEALNRRKTENIMTKRKRQKI
jgi:hypothetical protein